MNYVFKVEYKKQSIDDDFLNCLECHYDFERFKIDEVVRAVRQFEKYRHKAIKDTDLNMKYSVELFLTEDIFKRMLSLDTTSKPAKKCLLASYSLTKKFDDNECQKMKSKLEKAQSRLEILFKLKRGWFCKDEGKYEFSFDNLSTFLDENNTLSD